MLRAARYAIRAVRLGYLTGRAFVHIVMTPYEIGGYCPECNSTMVRTPTGVEINPGFKGAGFRDCPVHIAWRELLKAGA
jgi:hypothetical protein